MAADTELSKAWLDDALAALKLREVQDRLDGRAQSDGDPHADPLALRARAELAMRERCPPSDAVICARRALRDGWPDAPRYIAAGVRGLIQAGATVLAT